MAKCTFYSSPYYDSITFTCPGCGHDHSAYVRASRDYIELTRRNGRTIPIWQWNRDLEKPTITPSILFRTTEWNETEKIRDVVCHSFVEDGNIRFLSDCTHELRNQTVPLPEVK